MITIFTPTYNRAYILPQLYKSLQQQTTYDFEWLIVDDGSQDNTQELIRSWQQNSNQFPIVYIKQPNGGQHRAINIGTKHAKGEWFFIVDSDDWLPNDAIQKIIKQVHTLPKNSDLAGICGFRANKEAHPLGNCSKLTETLDASMIEIRQRYHIRGDMAEVFKTDILRQFPFPEFKGENFLNEAAVWNQIAEKYKLRYIPEILYFCEYREDGLTKSIRHKYRQNPQGTKYLYNNILTNPLFNKKAKIRAAILYWRYLWNRPAAYKTVRKWIFFCWPVGLLLYVWDGRKNI